MENPKEIIQELLLSNKQMAATLDIYTEYHLTKEEKVEAAAVFQEAQDDAQIEAAKERLKKIYDSAYQFSDQDSKWSPGFIRELLKYYEDQSGFNPIERLREPFAVVKAYFDYKANEDNLDEIDKEQLRAVEERLPEAMADIKEIYQELEA